MTERALPEEDLRTLVQTMDRLEAGGYVSVDDLRAAGVSDAVSAEAAQAAILLLDYRHRLVDGRMEPVTLCRLNRRHDMVRRLLG